MQIDNKVTITKETYQIITEVVVITTEPQVLITIIDLWVVLEMSKIREQLDKEVTVLCMIDYMGIKMQIKIIEVVKIMVLV